MPASRTQLATMYLSFGTLVALAFMFTATSGGQEVLRPAVEADGSLTWKFQAGQVIRMNMQQEIQVTMTLGATELDVTSQSTTEMTNTVREVDPQGTAKVTSVIDKLKFSSESTGMQLEFDSSSDQEPEGLSAEIADMLRPMIGVGLQQTITADGKVGDVEIPEKALAGFASANPMMASMFNRGTLEEIVTQSAVEFPSPNPQVGFTWETKKGFQMGPTRIAREITSEYLGVTDLDGKPVHRIRANIRLRFPDGVNGSPVNVTDETAVVEMYFDGVAGQLIKTSLNQDVTLNFDTGVQEITQKLEQSMVANFSWDN